MNRTVERTRRLTEAAAAAAIAAMFVLLKLIAPFLVFITMIVSASPIGAVAYFHGIKWGLGTSIAVILLVTIIGGPEIGLTTAVYAGALGLALGYSFSHKFSHGQAIFLTAIAYLVEMSYKVVFSIYVLGIADALSSMLERFVTFLHWLWQPLSSILGFDPDPGKAVFSASGAVMVALVFLLNGWCYAYLNVELFGELLKRLRLVRR